MVTGYIIKIDLWFVCDRDLCADELVNTNDTSVSI